MKDKKVYQVDTGGLRGELPLTDSQKDRISEYIKLVESGAPSNVGMIRWVDDKELNTAYGPGFDLLNIGSDVMPAPKQTTEVFLGEVNGVKIPRIKIKWRGEATFTANSRLTWKSSIAHELVGHREAALAGKTQLEDLLEEAQASIRAARFAPSLSSTERYTLLRDAITRLYKAHIRIRQVKNTLYINNR